VLREMRAEGKDADDFSLTATPEGMQRRQELHKELADRVVARFGAEPPTLSRPLLLGSVPAATAAFLRSHEQVAIKPKALGAKAQKAIDAGRAPPPATVAWQSKASLTKFRTLMADLSALRETEPGMRAVVFTRHDVVQERLVALIQSENKPGGALAAPAGHRALKVFEFNKHTAPTKRHKLIKDFQDEAGTGARVFVVTYATAAVGITLTAANRVFLMEPCIDPGLEAQAAGRIHRLGQTKDIFIKRYAFRHTIEEAIIALHAKIKDGVVKIVDGHMPPSANRVMAESCASTAQHDLSGPTHEVVTSGCEDGAYARLVVRPSGWREAYAKANRWERRFTVQECVVCATCRDVAGSSKWSGTGTFAYLNGCTRDPPVSHDTPDGATHFRPGGHGRFSRVPRPPDGWQGLRSFVLDNGERTPEGGFGVATVPDISPLVRAIAKAFVDRATENGLVPPSQSYPYLSAIAQQALRAQHATDPATLSLPTDRIRTMLEGQLKNSASRELSEELLWYFDKGLEEACDVAHGSQEWQQNFTIKPGVLESFHRGKGLGGATRGATGVGSSSGSGGGGSSSFVVE